MSTTASTFNICNYFLGHQRLDEIGTRRAISFRGRDFTYYQLRREVDAWDSTLTVSSIGEGDRVAMLVYDSPDFIACFLATVSRGAICVPINTYLTKDEVRFIIADSGARLIVAERELAQKFVLDDLQDRQLILLDDQLRPSLSAEKKGSGSLIEQRDQERLTTPGSPAFILYTSGSTGTPKGALHLHKNMRHTVEGFGDSVLKLTADDKVFSASRLFFAYGLGNSLSFPLHAGATVILESERPGPDTLRRIFSEQRPTVFFAVPAVYQAILNFRKGGGDIDAGSLRLCISAGEALPATVFEEWQREFGMTILDGIGSTEMLHMFISNQEGQARAGSSGKVVPGYQAKLIDDAGVELGEGDEVTGNLMIYGESAMAGYWNRDDLTAQVIRDGWLRTGDVYRRDRDNYFYHIGRSDDCFKVKGLWVSPVEVESALLAHEAVCEAAVISGNDEIGLATVKAFVVIRTESREESLKDELIDFAKSKLPPYKVPSEIEFLEELPRTSTGKIQRFKLRG